MVKHMKSFERAFLTGVDAKQEWMLPWFFKNYKKYNKLPVIVADFGMSPKGLELAKRHAKEIIDLTKEIEKGWFLKPKSMWKSPAKNTVWIDLDCEVRGDLSDIFKQLEPNKLCMVQDHPWVKRRGELWHNSGVVGFKDKPAILKSWMNEVGRIKAVGDQEVLHAMLNPITKITYIKDLPHKYNVLRLDVEDNNVPKDAVVVHWTGSKGKDEIRRQINA